MLLSFVAGAAACGSAGAPPTTLGQHTAISKVISGRIYSCAENVTQGIYKRVWVQQLYIDTHLSELIEFQISN